MNSPIIYIGGGKGGVGKSLATMAVVDYLRHAGRDLALIETDTSNADVWQVYKDIVPDIHTLDLDREDDWAELATVAHERPDKCIVINSAARVADSIQANGDYLARMAVDRRLIKLWVINRHRDSINLLQEFAETIPDGELHVLKNLFFGEPDRFSRFAQSTFVNAQTNMKVRNLEDLPDRIADRIYDDRKSLEEIVETADFGTVQMAERWRSKMHRALADLL